MTTEFENKKVNMETLPEYLTAARESFLYDVREVSHRTGISEKFIKDLEGGNYHRLPADVYVLGFLKKLAELYGADQAVLEAQYKKERNIHQSVHRYASGQVYLKNKMKQFSITPKTVIVAVSILIALSVLGYLGYQVHAVNVPPEITITQPKDNETFTTPSVLFTGTVDPGSKLTINGQDIFVNADGSFQQLISVSPGQKILTFDAVSAFGKQSEKQITIVDNYQTPDDAGAPAIAPVSLTITVNPNTALISVQIDGQQPVQETFVAGSSKTYTAQNKIIVSTSDAGSTSVVFDGKDLGKLGKDGEALRNIPFTADSLVTTPTSSGN
jgi:cytoskeletal protein RodZ